MPELERLEAEVAAAAPYFDEAYYARSLPELPDTVTDPLEHFCSTGWKQLRKPRADFDVWWYWANHLDPADDATNPLVHYALVGRDAGLSTRPASTTSGPGAVLPTDRAVRRATLFAGFDAQGIVDEAVLILLRELARFSDVFVLFDGYLPESELAKLREVAQDAWAIRHGAYDFGSYAMLARELVGWERLEQYDEVLFVNDSSYLVRPLDAVFERMDAQACDWWGLQATKGIAMTRDVPENGFPDPIPLDTVREELLDGFEDAVTYDFLVGSYFLAFRRPVLNSPVFRRLVNGVTTQRSKRLVIQKYEIGLTHLLIGHGHRFSTFVPTLQPFHPVYTRRVFGLIADGFPLLKRFLLYRNHYDVPALARWKETVRAIIPDAPVDAFETNLLRTAPADGLARSFAIEERDDGTVDVPDWDMTPTRFSKLDAAATQDLRQWAFVVDRETHQLPDNSRAIFEQVAHDPGITKVILTRSRRIPLSGENVVTLPVRSPQGREALMRSGIVLVADRPLRATDVRVKTERHHVIAVRRGLTLLKYGRTAAAPRVVQSARPTHEGPLEMLHPAPTRVFDAVLAASDADRLAAVASNWSTRYVDAWPTGIPAHDFLVRDDVPADLHEQEQRLREELDGRRLVLFTTILPRRGFDAEPYLFTPTEVDRLASAAEDAGAVLGIREADGDLDRATSRAFGTRALDISVTRYPSVHAVLRATDLVVTDVDGVALDFTLTGRPAISFVHDLEQFDGRLLYDLDHVFPGPVCRDTKALAAEIDRALADPTVSRQYARVRELFVEHADGRSSRRVVERLLGLAPKRQLS
ncbi:CDP-glycerol glycerophosphotransferase family protein [Aeromicrobium choanae]|nr:CDP-glycerol glycerophosphotransferase family protein [Aeromicrobium choanae]